jgi:hypothetical protein
VVVHRLAVSSSIFTLLAVLLKPTWLPLLLLLPLPLPAGCVVFDDAASARRAIAGCGHPLAPEDLASAPDGLDKAMMDWDATSCMHTLWHRGKDFIKGRDASGKDIKVRVCLSVWLSGCLAVPWPSL